MYASESVPCKGQGAGTFVSLQSFDELHCFRLSERPLEIFLFHASKLRDFESRVATAGVLKPFEDNVDLMQSFLTFIDEVGRMKC